MLVILHQAFQLQQGHITLFPQEAVSENALGGALRPKDVFDLLKLSLNDSAIRSGMGQNWTVVEAEKEFFKRQKQVLNLQAEIQIVLFFCQIVDGWKNCISYFDCSKHGWFMCSRIKLRRCM